MEGGFGLYLLLRVVAEPGMASAYCLSRACHLAMGGVSWRLPLPSSGREGSYLRDPWMCKANAPQRYVGTAPYLGTAAKAHYSGTRPYQAAQVVGRQGAGRQADARPAFPCS